MYRAHLARRRVRQLMDARYASLAAAVRHAAAAAIQRTFKGFYSRRHVHDFYSRKAYVAAVAARGEALRAELEGALAAQLAAKLDAEEAAARASFDAATRGLHHLVSTKAQPGVYNPPWARRMEDVPSAFGVPLETHLRVGVLRHLRTTGLHPASTAAAAVTAAAAAAAATAGASTLAAGTTVAALGSRNVTFVPAYVQPTRGTLQAAAPYDAPLEAARLEARHAKYKNLDQRPFVAGAKPRAGATIGVAPVGVSVNASEPYVATHVRARMSRDLERTEGRDKRVSADPYVTASSRASRLFEDSERRAAAFAAAVQQRTLAATRGSDAGSAATALGRTLSATMQSATTANEPAHFVKPVDDAAAMAATLSLAASTAAARAATVRVGNAVQRLAAAPAPVAPHAAEAPAPAPAPPMPARARAADPADAAYTAYPAGSGASAVRRARDALAPPSAQRSVRGGSAAAGAASAAADGTGGGSGGSDDPFLPGGEYEGKEDDDGGAAGAGAGTGSRRPPPLPLAGAGAARPTGKRPLMKPPRAPGTGTVGAGLPAGRAR